jgi:HPt (histidine-containing phosphotransfer) domain-containing protein
VFSEKSHNQHRSKTQHSSDAPLKPLDSNLIVVPSSPRIVVLPSTSDQLPSLLLSISALVVSLYVLRKTMAQKRNEHAARFFHEVVVDNAIEPTLAFYKALRLFTETEPAQLAKLADGTDKVEKIREAMRAVRDNRREAANTIARLAAPFDAALEQRLEASLDHIADDVEEWIDEYTSPAGATQKDISIKLANSQSEIITLFREHEFRIAWPSWRQRVRQFRLALVRWLSPEEPR